MSKKATQKDRGRADVAREARAEIARIARELGDPHRMLSIERRSIAIWTRFSRPALEKALRLAKKYRETAPMCRVDVLEDALAYEATVAPVITAARDLARHLEDGILARWARSGPQALGLVLSLEGRTRVIDDPEAEHDLRELKALLHPRRKKGVAADTPKSGRARRAGAKKPRNA